MLVECSLFFSVPCPPSLAQFPWEHFCHTKRGWRLVTWTVGFEVSVCLGYEVFARVSDIQVLCDSYSGIYYTQHVSYS